MRLSKELLAILCRFNGIETDTFGDAEWELAEDYLCRDISDAKIKQMESVLAKHKK